MSEKKPLFSGYLKAMIDKKKIGIRELGRKSGLDPSFISKLLKDKRNPPEEEYIQKLAEALEADSFLMTVYAGRIPGTHMDFFSRPEVLETLREKRFSPGKEQPSPEKYVPARPATAVLPDDLL